MFSFFILIIIIMVCWPMELFKVPYSTLIEDRNGQLLGARIAADGQWRFPGTQEVPEKFEKAVVYFEDEYFYYHPGINPVSIGRAFIQNLKAGKVVSGGSTITMQLARAGNHRNSRSLINKIGEMFLSLKIDLVYRKSSILKLFASHAPFGGNVVGLEAASWRYFGKSPENLSWAEAATLAVLPNSPSMIHPGKNREKLLVKRNKLLDKLRDKGVIDFVTCSLAKEEPLPDKPHILPNFCPHLLDRAGKDHPGERIKTSIQLTIQRSVAGILESHRNYLEANEIHNAAVLILDVKKGEVSAYIGNLPTKNNEDHGNQVDVILAPRSTGSILKPVLFQTMLAEGEILPGTLVADIPTQIGGFAPKNYTKDYDGAVPARQALSRSLNIPAVKMLQDYGVSRFYHVLKSKGMTTLRFPADHYGLSLILGGAEGSLWDICQIYARYSAILQQYNADYQRQAKFQPEPLTYLNTDRQNWSPDGNPTDFGSIWACFEALRDVNRPESEMGWEAFSDGRKMAWKTGTSFGFRDGWAIGTTPEYVVGVWTGNADGEGRPGLTGIGMAAPILFDVYKSLPQTSWFKPPWDDLEKTEICRQSGYRAGPDCPERDSLYIPLKGLQSPPCPYHKIVHLEKGDQYRVNLNCADIKDITTTPWFILPPVMEWYYKPKNPLYKTLPPMKPGCSDPVDIRQMEFIFPRDANCIFVPRELDGSPGKVVFEVAHRQPDAIIYWHLNDQFIKTTQIIHQLAINPDPGDYKLVLTDQNGNRLVKEVSIESLNR